MRFTVTAATIESRISMVYSFAVHLLSAFSAAVSVVPQDNMAAAVGLRNYACILSTGMAVFEFQQFRPIFYILPFRSAGIRISSISAQMVEAVRRYCRHRICNMDSAYVVLASQVAGVYTGFFGNTCDRLIGNCSDEKSDCRSDLAIDINELFCDLYFSYVDY